jgi:hypothetical protein
MIRKVYEVDPMICSKCGGRMKVVAFITEVGVVNRIIDHLILELGDTIFISLFLSSRS